MMPLNLVFARLTELRSRIPASAAADPKAVSAYVWEVTRVLLHRADEIDSVSARRMLADCLSLPVERPSKLYSSLLSAAVRVATVHSDFRFATFLRMWDIAYLRPEDHEPQKAEDGRTYPSLIERVTSALGHSLPLHSEDREAMAAILASPNAEDIFPTAVGYIDGIDTEHAHIHIYDSFSRHFVAPFQPTGSEREGDFVRFIPVIPTSSRFKTAIILASLPAASPEVDAILREVRITAVDRTKGYASWQLTDPSRPITELLSPLQLSAGETSPSFTSGYLSIPSLPADATALSIPTTTLGTPLAVGQTLQAFIYLRRGRDRLKRPHLELP